MKALQYNRRSTEKLVLKGVVDSDYLHINYSDEDGHSKAVSLLDVMRRFEGQNVSITVAMNTDEDLLDEGELPMVDGEDTEDDGGEDAGDDDGE